MRKLDSIEIEGFKSIKHLQLQLGSVNVLIGQNGAGKSNFISFFRMLSELIEERLQLYVARSGGANALLHYGAKITPEMTARMFFKTNGYLIKLAPTEDDRLLFAAELDFGPFEREAGGLVLREIYRQTGLRCRCPPPSLLSW